jgi:hypothetical protein
MKSPSAIFDTPEATGFARVIPYHQKKYPYRITVCLTQEQYEKVSGKNRQDFIRKLIDKA